MHRVFASANTPATVRSPSAYAACATASSTMHASTAVRQVSAIVAGLQAPRSVSHAVKGSAGNCDEGRPGRQASKGKLWLLALTRICGRRREQQDSPAEAALAMGLRASGRWRPKNKRRHTARRAAPRCSALALRGAALRSRHLEDHHPPTVRTLCRSPHIPRSARALAHVPRTLPGLPPIAASPAWMPGRLLAAYTTSTRGGPTLTCASLMGAQRERCGTLYAGGLWARESVSALTPPRAVLSHPRGRFL